MDRKRFAETAALGPWTEIHAGSEFYDVASFRDGDAADPAARYELEEVGPVEGKTLLHLQCHFGLDTLSWARGARWSLAPTSARRRSRPRGRSRRRSASRRRSSSRTSTTCPRMLEGQFDIVYTSRGVLGWLPDIVAWAAVAAHFVKPGGTFYIAEIHPVAQRFENEGVEPGELRLEYPYWTHESPQFDVRARTPTVPPRPRASWSTAGITPWARS